MSRQLLSHQRLIWTLWCSQCVAITGLTVIVPHLPLYMKELTTGQDAVQWWSSLCLLAPACTQICSAPLWGYLGDRWGRKWMIVRAMLGLAFVFLMMFLAQNAWQFFLCRLLQGVCGGVVEANVAFAASQSRTEKAGQTLGFLNGATAAGSLLGPVLGSVFAALWGYKLLFLVTGGLLTVCAFWIILTIQETQPQTETEPASRSTPVLTEILSTLFGHHILRAALLLGICAQMGIYGFVGIMALHIDTLLQDTRSVGLWVGGLQAATWGTTLLSSTWWGRRNDHFRVETNLVWAAIGCGMSMFMQSLLPYLLLLILLRVLQGFFFSALLPSIYLCVRHHVPSKSYSAYIGVVSSLLVCGQIFGPLVASLLSMSMPLPWVIGWLSLLYLAGAAYLFCMLYINRRQSALATALERSPVEKD